MKILSVFLQNFASYESLKFDFRNQGLTLIHGATGSGKSTLCDAVPWILFGTTAKGGKVDEILSWNVVDVTSGLAVLEVNGRSISVSRQRGKNNDLQYWTEEDGPGKRGKDLNDTQNMINQLLGVTPDLYLAGAYFHEFSQTAQFFHTTAKNRRTICEQIVDLSLPITLQTKSSEKRKHIKLDISKLESEKVITEAQISNLSKQAERQNSKSQEWIKNKEYKIKSLYEKFELFEVEKAERIKNLQEAYTNDLVRLRKATVCTECGASKLPNAQADNPFLKRSLIQERKTENHYFEQILALEAEVNPFNTEIVNNEDEIELLKIFLCSNTSNIKLLNQNLDDILILSDVIDRFRAILISNTVSNLEASTNQFLSDHFDAEIRVSFNIENDDKLDVSIFKDGNSCVYTQLSKGQRCLLKLCFGISVMKEVANHHGVNFSQIFFDEALDGLDSEFKLKALSLLQSLELQYESIFLVEHSSEIKASCSNSYNVCLVNGHSVVDEKAG